MLKRILTAFILLLLLTSVSQAVENGSDTIESFKDNIKRDNFGIIDEFKNSINQNKEDKREEIVKRVCNHLEDKVDLKVARFEANKNIHVEKYQRLKNRLMGVLDKLEDKGLDISQLEEDLETLDELIKDYAKAYEDFVESLRFTKGYACGESDGDFKDALKEAKEKLAVVKRLRREIRDFYVNTIRKDIKDLRKQASDLREVEESDSSEE